MDIQDSLTINAFSAHRSSADDPRNGLSHCLQAVSSLSVSVTVCLNASVLPECSVVPPNDCPWDKGLSILLCAAVCDYVALVSCPLASCLFHKFAFVTILGNGYRERVNSKLYLSQG